MESVVPSVVTVVEVDATSFSSSTIEFIVPDISSSFSWFERNVEGSDSTVVVAVSSEVIVVERRFVGSESIVLSVSSGDSVAGRLLWIVVYLKNN